jgi:CheY-like chemotaxis protein
MSDPPEEKREHERRPFVLRVSYGPDVHLYDATENVSEGGFFIQTDREFEIGETIPVSLSFPGLLDPVEIVGKVAWIRSSRGDHRGGIGIHADRDEDRRKLESLVALGGQTEVGNAVQPPADGYRVLIVEDNPHIIEMYSYVLKKLAANTLGGKVPLEVHFAPDGHGALKLLLEGHFNLVMTDLYMPVMDGFALVERIRSEERLRSIPVIVISAGGKDAQERAAKLGVDIYLRKPVKFVDVLETVKQLLHLT